MYVRSGNIDYDQFADIYQTHRQAVRRVVDHIVAQLAGAAPADILEVGCGTANHLAEVAAALGARGWGFDQSGGMLEAAREAYPHLTLTEGNAEERYPFGDSQFDLVMAVDMIHYVRDLPRFVTEAFRVLRPGGQCVIVTWSEQDIRTSTIAQYFPDTVAVDLKRMPGVPKLQRGMRSAGFARTRTTRTDYSYPFDETEVERFRQKAYTELLLIGPEAFDKGMLALLSDVNEGRARYRELYSYVWGKKD